MSGGVSFMDASVEALKRRCLHHLESNLSLNDADDDYDSFVGDAIQFIHHQLCVERCSPHGHCRQGMDNAVNAQTPLLIVFYCTRYTKKVLSTREKQR